MISSFVRALVFAFKARRELAVVSKNTNALPRIPILVDTDSVARLLRFSCHPDGVRDARAAVNHSGVIGVYAR